MSGNAFSSPSSYHIKAKLYLNPDSETYTLSFSGSGAMYDFVWNPITKKDESYIKNWHTSAYASKITQIVFEQGSSITTIGNSAFYGLSALTSINLPDTIEHIGAGAFANSGLLELNTKNAKYVDSYCAQHSPIRKLTTNVSSLSDSSQKFDNLPDLEELHLGADVQTINGWAISYCPNLATIKVAANNPYIKAVDNVVFSKDGKTLLLSAPAKTGEYAIPSGVESLQGHSFRETRISRLIFPESVTSIGGKTFSSVNGMTQLSLPSTLTNLEKHILNSAFTLHSIDMTRVSQMPTINANLSSDDSSLHPALRILYVNSIHSGHEQQLLNALKNSSVPVVVAQTNGKVFPDYVAFEEGVLAQPKIDGLIPRWYTDQSLTIPLEQQPQGGQIYFADWVDGAPVLTLVSVKRTGPDSAEIAFASDEGGRYYYAVTESGTAPAPYEEGSGSPLSTKRQSIVISDVKAEMLDVHITAYDAVGNRSTAIFTCQIPPYVDNTSVDSTPAVMPATGDHSQLGLWMILLAASGVVTALYAVHTKEKCN